MHYFQYKDKELFCEDVSIAEIAEKVGTPFYLYSHGTLVRHYHAFDRAFGTAPHIVCYSVKANSNIGVLKTFINEGSGLDIVSGGELYRALQAGAPPEKVVFSGVGKSNEEIEYAIKTGILMFNVESSQELRRINAAAERLGTMARVSIRVNPDVDPKTHPYISTGLKKNKFGIEADKAIGEYVYARDNLKNLDIIGIDTHIGSQITETAPFSDALKKTKGLVNKLRGEGINIEYLDVGGGLGITYDKEEPPYPSKYGKAIIAETKDMDVTLIFEPGRVIVGNAGILVSKVLYTKTASNKNFIIVDAAMNDLARPSLYGSYHAIWPVNKDKTGEITADVVGPVCESGDFFAKDRELPLFSSGDLIAVMSVGAYGFAMSSNYNSRCRAAEVMVLRDKWEVIRRRESFEDIIRGESMPDFIEEAK